jgi:hypothetical protein
MRYKKVLKIFLPFVVMLSCGISNVMAQARYFGEFGILGGGSFYNGDANTSKVFLEPHLAFGGLLRINLTNRGALKINIIRGAVSGDSRNMDNALPGGVQVEFERDFWDVGFHFEHNFFKYGLKTWDREVKRHTPYILLGPGITIFDEWRGTELTFNLTYGVGYKFKFGKRFNLGLEWSMRKLFIDDFDVTNKENKILDDPYKMGYSWIKNNDYYSTVFLFLSVDLIRKKNKCNVLQF